MDPVLARKLARTANPYASIVFLAPEVETAYEAVGLPQGRMGYFAGRAAPMGAVSGPVVVAAFYGFQPELVLSFIPAAWSHASPEVILERRLAATDAALRRVLGDETVDGPALQEAAQLARLAAEACAPEGRALFAGWSSLPWPEPAHLSLFHSLTLLREHRGDGHLIALQVGGYAACDAIVMHDATGEVPAQLAASRRWSPEQWAASVESLRARGLLDAAAKITDAGRASRDAIEDMTDQLASAPVAALGEGGVQRLRELLRPLSAAIAADTLSRIHDLLPAG